MERIFEVVRRLAERLRLACQKSRDIFRTSIIRQQPHLDVDIHINMEMTNIMGSFKTTQPVCLMNTLGHYLELRIPYNCTQLSPYNT